MGYNPRGTITGGSKANNMGKLADIAKYNEYLKLEAQTKKDINDLEMKLNILVKDARRYHDINKKIEINNHKLNNLKEKYQSSLYAVLVKQDQDNQVQLNKYKLEITDVIAELSEADKLKKNLEEKIKKFREEQQKLLKEKEKEINDLKKQHKKIRKQVTSLEEERDEIKEQLESQKEELENL